MTLNNSGIACRHLTRAKKPCKNPVVAGLTCIVHLDELDRKIIDLIQHAHSSAWEASREHANDEINMLKKQVAQLKSKLETELSARKRYSDDNGYQLVEVLGRYTYRWKGSSPLQVGDIVMLPPNIVNDTVWRASVTNLGTNYNGSISTIVRAEGKA